MKIIVTEWIDYAEGDFQAAKVLSDEHKPRYEIIAYHCQQSAEKFLKALFVQSNRKIPKTHDLGILVDELLDLYPTLSNIS